jgi:glycosyltransferase involved in cell wall biosynthesis
MAKYLPTNWPGNRCSALFPGSDIIKASQNLEADDKPLLKLLYVGGIIPPLYDLKSMFNTVGALENVELTVCCRDFEWEYIHSYYEPFSHVKIKIVHLQGEQLKELYRNTDLFGLFWKPYPYLEFAMPVKVFETLGYAVPIITSAGTEVARFVEQEGIGWVVTNEEEFSNLLKFLQGNRRFLIEKRRHLETVRLRHTWQRRAQTVADTLRQQPAPRGS